jgi:F-type H+-transporting ATPase subunit delta
MEDLQTVARPYAKAFFELAVEHNSLKEWSDVLSALSTAVQDKNMQRMLSHPEVTEEMLTDTLSAILKKMFKADKGFDVYARAICTMAKHRRLAVIAEVARQFETLKATHEKMCSGVVYTAIELDKQQLSQLETGLQKKLNKTVHLNQVVQPELLGGAKVQIGDMVIDGTLRGRLQRLSQSLFSAS